MGRANAVAVTRASIRKRDEGWGMRDECFATRGFAQLFISHPSALIPLLSRSRGRRRRRRRGGGGLIAERLEVDLRRLGWSGYSPEVRLRLEPGEVRHQIRRELDYGGVELLRHLV